MKMSFLSDMFMLIYSIAALMAAAIALTVYVSNNGWGIGVFNAAVAVSYILCVMIDAIDQRLDKFAIHSVKRELRKLYKENDLMGD